MPVFLTISKHAPDKCAAYNEKARKAAIAAISKADELMKKHGIKGIGIWSVPTEHVLYWIVEASFEAFQKLSMEPEVMALSEFNVSVTKMLTPMEESAKLLQHLEAR